MRPQKLLQIFEAVCTHGLLKHARTHELTWFLENSNTCDKRVSMALTFIYEHWRPTWHPILYAKFLIKHIHFLGSKSKTRDNYIFVLCLKKLWKFCCKKSVRYQAFYIHFGTIFTHQVLQIPKKVTKNLKLEKIVQKFAISRNFKMLISVNCTN